MDILLVRPLGQAVETTLIERILRPRDVGIMSVETYKDAIEALAKNHYPIALLDCFESEGDIKVTDAMRIMKQIVPNLLLIAISEEKPLETERELRRAGLHYYLTKPLDEIELTEVLFGAVDQKQKRRGS